MRMIVWRLPTYGANLLRVVKVFVTSQLGGPMVAKQRPVLNVVGTFQARASAAQLIKRATEPPQRPAQKPGGYDLLFFSSHRASQYASNNVDRSLMIGGSICMRFALAYPSKGGWECSLLTCPRRKRAEDELRQSEERSRVIADAIPQIVWVTDAEGRVEFFNRQWSECTPVSRSSQP